MLTVYVTDINGVKHEILCADYELVLVGAVPRLIMFDKNHNVIACFILDKIVGYKVNRKRGK